ncbi:MAG: polysaccharide pyruvyl transferase family protein [Chloroflexota bacterium]|nr:polysaccharide pyruvyl transferase family protein [Chloroflexota bacterium]MDQ5866250.1 polysaccharide pyruvyl transferase family protein [Chloroflexota bacterium]
MPRPDSESQPQATRQPPRKKIAILGWYGSANAGDEAVLQSVVESLRRAGHEGLLVLSTNPGRTAATYGVESLPRNPLSLATLRAVRQSKALILGGGGLIQDSSSVYNLPLYALYVVLARSRGVPVFGWGLGVGPLYTRLGRLLARFIFRSSRYFSVRDTESARALRSAGIRPDKIRVTADPAFLIEPAAPPQDTKSQRPTIVFCVRHRLHDDPGLNVRYLLPVSVRHRLKLETQPGVEEDRRFVHAVARGVRCCVQELGARVVLLPFWAERDDEVLRQVEQEALRLGVPGTEIGWAQVRHTPSDLAGYLRNADLLVSMRLHALVFGATGGVPSLALSYVPKMRALMTLLGARRWVVEVQTRVPSPEEIEMKLRQLWALRRVEADKVKQAASRLRARAAQDARTIGELLES